MSPAISQFFRLCLMIFAAFGLTCTGAAAEEPFVNSLGMKFVPIPGTKILMCTTDTTVAQYRAAGMGYEPPPFPQGPTHPAVNVNWNDARAWCRWLSKKEGRKYRLPTDREWSCAVGIADKEPRGGTPWSKDGAVPGYPWGDRWPPCKGCGNYRGQEMLRVSKAQVEKVRKAWDFFKPTSKLKGFSDGYPFTSPVGSFSPNRYGLFDMGGNVWQFCEDHYASLTERMGNSQLRGRVMRGASWNNDEGACALSSCRGCSPEDRRDIDQGFRCVLVK